MFNIKMFRVPEREIETVEVKKSNKLYKEHLCKPPVPDTINDKIHPKAQHCAILEHQG